MNHPVVEALGWSLIHSLWECSVLTLLFAALHLVVRSASARYVAGSVTMLLMLTAPLVTFVSTFEQGTTLAVASVERHLPSEAAAAPLGGTLSPIAASPAAGPRFLEITVWLWMAGVILMTGWSAAGWILAQRLRWRSKRATAALWQRRLQALAARLQLHRTVRLYESALAQVPAVIGWLRPVILVPAGALINLSPQELEAVLAHELAHIRRHDYLANLLQTAIETLLFYHPGVWWVGRRIRAEREHCCDDLAVQACGDRLVYARALASLEELRCGNAQFAMAATGGELPSRIRRLFGKRPPARRSLPIWLLAMAAVALSLLFFMQARSAHANNAAQTPVAVADPERMEHTASTVVIAQPRPQARTRPMAAPVPATLAPRAPVGIPTPMPEPASTVPLAQPLTPAPPAPELAPLSPGPVTPPPAIALAPAQPGPATPPPPRGQGYLAGLADAGYTNISVDEIIDLKNNNVSPDYIKSMLHAGLGTLTPKELIKLRTYGVQPDYARAVKASSIRDADVEGIIHLHQNGVRVELLEALGAAGYKDVTVAQAILAQSSGLSGAAIRSLHEQGFKNLTLEQVIKLKRAGVI